MNRILIVDDEKDNLQALMRLLRGQFQVETTTSPFEALKLIQKDKFSVIISDQRMPEMKGVDLLEKVKHVAPSTTRVLLTGYTEIESVIDAINRGNVYRYIAKPWDPEELKTIVKQADEAYRLRLEVDEKNRDLTKAVADLKKLDQAKGRFLSLISHELNTPLTVMTSFLSILDEKKSALGDDGVKALQAIGKATQRLTDIVSEVITYVKTDLHGDLALTKFDLQTAMQAAIESVQATVNAKKLSVKSKLTSVEIQADKSKVGMILNRLLSETALKSPPNSELKLELLTDGNDALVRVWRQGETVSPSAFDPLELSGEVLNHQQSIGLGLALGKMIVEAHGGTVHLSSDKVAGTMITYRLPRS